MNKHFVIDPNGKKHTRNSQNRKYEFAIVVRESVQAKRDRIDRAYTPKHLESNFNYYRRCLDDATRPSYGASRVDALNALQGCDDVETYAEMKRLNAHKDLDLEIDEGVFDKYGVWGWCGNWRLAEAQHNKAVKTGRFSEVHTVKAEIA